VNKIIRIQEDHTRVYFTVCW